MITEVNVQTGEKITRDYTAAELAEIASRPAPPDPVYSCTPWQIRKALNQLNLRDQVEAMVAASTDRDLKDGWEFAEVFLSNDPFVITMGVGLGKDEADIAELIQWAGTL